jgi:hypothetical protein
MSAHYGLGLQVRDYLKKGICAACEPKVRWRENVRSVYKAAGFVDRRSLAETDGHKTGLGRLMIKKKKPHPIPGLAAVLAAFLSAACLQPANEVPNLEYVPQGLRDISANFSVAADSDMIIVGFEGGAFQSGVAAGDFELRVINGASVSVNTPVADSETQAVLAFDSSLSPGSYNLTIKAKAFSRNPSRLTVKAVRGDGTWSAALENTGFNRNPIYGLSYGSGKYVAGGGGGNLSYSRDGDTWTNIPPGSTVTQSKFTQDVRSIAYGNGMFYAVGKSGQVAYSADGQNWTGYSESIFDNVLSINAVIYGGGKFLAAGEGGRMMYMPDDSGWTRAADSRFGDRAVRTLAWGRLASGENRYVAGGDDGQLCFSGDGVNWTYSGNTTDGTGTGNAKEQFGNIAVNGLAFGGGYFVAVLDNGKIYRSGNGGMNWEERYAVPGGTGLLSIVYGSGIFIAAGHNGRALASGDGGETWTPMTVPFSTGDQISCAAYSAGRFILAGNPYPDTEGQLTGNSRLAAAYFKPAVVPAPEAPADLVSTPFILAAGDNQIMITLTGGTFKELPVAGDFDLSSAGFSGGTIERDRQNPLIAVFKGIAVTAPGSGKTITIKAGALSVKAVSAAVTVRKNLAWTTIQNTGFGTSNIRGIAYGNNKYVAVGAGKIAASPDGVTWTEIPSSAGDNRWAEEGNYVDFQGIAYGNGRFIAVGYWLHSDDGNGWGVAAVSTDGINWTMKGKILTTGDDSAHIYAITWTGVHFVVVGRWGRSAASTDGTTWTMTQITGFSWMDNSARWEDAYAVASDGTGKVVAGGASGKLSYSTDHGVTWTWIANNFFSPDKAIRAIAFNSEKTLFIAAGEGGNMKIAVSGQVTAGSGSDGGDNWQGVDSKFGETGINTLASGGGKIIAAGHNGKMSESADGSGWTALGAGTGSGQSGFTGEEQIACAVYGGGKFVIGGNAYNDKGNVSKIAYSNQ